MAELPQYRRSSIVEQIGVIPASTAAADVLGQVSATFGELSQSLFAEEREELKAQRTAYLATVQNTLREKAIALRAQHPTDPEGFRAAWQGVVSGTAEGVDAGVRAEVQADAQRIGLQEWDALMAARTAQDQALQEEALTSGASWARDTWLSYAGRGLGASPQAEAEREAFLSMQQGLVDAGFRSEILAAEEIRKADAEARGLTVMAFNQETYRQEGYAAAWTELEAFQPDPDMPPEIADRLRDGQQEWLREQHALAEIQEADAKESLERQGDAASKAGWALYADGGLTRQWIEKNRTALKPSEYKALLDAAAGGGARVDNAGVYEDLLADVYRGENIEAAALKAHRQGQIKSDTLASLLGKNRELSRADGPPSLYDQGLAKINAFLAPKAGELSAFIDPGEVRRRELARQEYARWYQAVPEGRTAAEVDAMTNEVIRRYSFEAFREATDTLPLPMYFVGDRLRPNLPATAAAILRAERRGDISHEIAVREAELLARWEAALAASRAGQEPPQ